MHADHSVVALLMGVQGRDLATDPLKELLDVNGVLGTCLHHDGAYGFGIVLGVLQGNLPNIGEITLVPSNGHYDILWAMFFQFFDPFLQGMK